MMYVLLSFALIEVLAIPLKIKAIGKPREPFTAKDAAQYVLIAIPVTAVLAVAGLMLGGHL